MGLGVLKNLTGDFAAITCSTIISNVIFFLCVIVCLHFQLILHLVVFIIPISSLAKL
jgi:hypothetical protein